MPFPYALRLSWEEGCTWVLLVERSNPVLSSFALSFFKGLFEQAIKAYWPF